MGQTPSWKGQFIALAALVLAVVTWTLGRTTTGASEDDARSLLSALTAENCSARLEAISRYSRSEDNQKDHNAALRRLGRIAPPAISEQIATLVALSEESRKGSARLAILAEKAAQSEQLDKTSRLRALEQVRRELLQIIHSPKEPIGARVGASWPLVRILRAAAQDHPEWTEEWANTLGATLKSSDDSLRVVGAATAALRRFPEGTDPGKADIVRPLIDGLGHSSASVRSVAYMGLRQALQQTDNALCFNATDSPDRRAIVVQRWEEWWRENKLTLAQDRIVQKFW